MKTTGNSSWTIGSGSGTRRPRRGGGFTLIELVAVVVIVGILALTAVPVIATISGSRQAFAARDLLRDLTFARQHAMASGARCWVVFDSATNQYEVRSESFTAPGFAGAQVIDDPATGKSFVRVFGTGDYQGVAITNVNFDAGEVVGFDWLGRPLNENEVDLAAEGSVTLTGGYSVTVAVDTGHLVLTTP